MKFIKPCFFNDDDENYKLWIDSMKNVEETYNRMIENGATPQEARSILPNSIKTELVMTMNLREWRHFFRLRSDKAAHPQMRELSDMILKIFKQKLPVLFDDLTYSEE